jgi:hypothetical protein
MKKFKITASHTTHHEAQVLAADENQAWLLAKGMDITLFERVKDGANWCLIDSVEIPVQLTADQHAFITAYGEGVGDYPAEVVKAWFLIDDGDEFNERYGAGNSAYTSIADAHNMWRNALAYARENK